MERRLFVYPEEAGGYFLENGAALCDNGTMEGCHLRAEATLITCEEIREKTGIEGIVLPRTLYPDQRYDKWGNPYLSSGMRTKGPLFYDSSVQKILRTGGVLGSFTDYVKHPRTSHLPWSEGATDDDEFVPALDTLIGSEIVATAKLDGEQTSCYRDYLHSRSIDGRHTPAQDWIRNFHAQWAWQIPQGWRVCGENMFEVHTIEYHLKTYFFVHSVWDERNQCLAWDEVIEWCGLLGLSTVPLLYRGRWDERLLRSLYTPRFENNPLEGYVVRVAQRFLLAEFPYCVGKFVARSFAKGRDARHGTRSNKKNTLG